VDFYITQNHLFFKFLWTIATSLLEGHLYEISAQNCFFWVQNSAKKLQIGTCDIQLVLTTANHRYERRGVE